MTTSDKLFTAFPEKTTFADNDVSIIVDSEDSYKIKKIKKSTMKGDDWATPTAVDFVWDDMVFTKDNGDTVTLVGAKTDLKEWNTDWNTVGNTVWNTVGNTVGNTTGNTIWNTVGNTVGNTAGNTTGNTLNNTLNNTDWNTVGNTVGNTIGNTLNNTDGNTIWNTDGNTDGNTVGNTDWNTVWNTVGNTLNNTDWNTVGNTIWNTTGNTVWTVQRKGNWAAGAYLLNDGVYNAWTSYVANKNTSEEPSISATDWDVMALKWTNGTDGDDWVGITSIIKTGTVWLVDTYTITFTDSSNTTFDITNWDDGTDGNDWNWIVSVTLISTVWKVKTYRILFTDTTTFDFIVTDWADWVGSGDISGSGTANEIAYFTAEKTIDNLPVSTYPSLTELAYVKGVTKSLQPQIDGKNSYHWVVARPVWATNPLPTTINTTTFTLWATANPISYYYMGVKVDVTTDKTATLDDGTAWLYYVYFNAATGNILATKNMPWIDATSNVIIATVYWNGTDLGLVSDERHSYNRNKARHVWAHNTVWCRYRSWLTLTHNWGTGAAATFALTAWEIADEDIQFAIDARTNARVFYQSGATAYSFVNTLSTIPFYAGANNRPNYVRSDTYATVQMTSAINKFINIFVYATTDLWCPLSFVTETVSPTVAANNWYNSANAARAIPFPNLSWLGTRQEIKPIYRLIARADWRIEAIDTTQDDYRLVSSLPMWAGTTSTTASAVTFNPYDWIAAGNVQAAIEELADERVVVNTAITWATKTKITYDAKGLVTGGADATTADIADSTNKRYITDAQLTVIGNTSGTNTGDNAANTSSVAKSLYDAHSILAATTDDTPAALTVAEQTVVGRITGGNIKSLTATEIRTLINVADGATANAKASSSDIDTGSDDTKFATAKAMKDSGYLSSMDDVSAASDTVAGKIEIATTAETNTWADATRAVSPDWLSQSYAGTKGFTIIAVDAATSLTVADGKAYVTIPECMNGMNLVRANAVVNTAGTTNATTIDIYNVTDSHDMLSTAISIASAGTVGTAGTVNTSYDDVATNDVLRIDVTSMSTTAPKGLMVVLEFRLP